MRGQSILLVSDNAALCAAARINLEGRTKGLRVASVSNVDAARRILPDAAPDVILLEEPTPAIFSETVSAVSRRANGSALNSVANGDSRNVRQSDLSADLPGNLHATSAMDLREELRAGLRADVSLLAKFAPVIVIGTTDHPDGRASLLASGAAGYVERTRESWPVALQLVEQRLTQQRLTRQQWTAQKPPSPAAIEEKPIELPSSNMKDAMKNPGEPLKSEDFGEVLRHELNNPLTGILGNAELLLAEIRRNDDGRLPPGGLQRLETITALAVRMRETIRRISQEWVANTVVVRKQPGT
jgi:signal transduction histidine kinase